MAARSPRGPGRRPPARGARGKASAGARGARPASRSAATGASRPTVSAAPKAAPAGTGPQLTTRAVVLLTVVLLLIASYTSTLHAWWQQRADIQSTRAEIVMRKQSIVDLEDQIARWDDPAYVKQQAKERFGWVAVGEVGYRVIGSDGKVQGADVPTLDSPARVVPPTWYKKLWSSAKEAGKAPSATPTPEPDPSKVLKNE